VTKPNGLPRVRDEKNAARRRKLIPVFASSIQHLMFRGKAEIYALREHGCVSMIMNCEPSSILFLFFVFPPCADPSWHQQTTKEMSPNGQPNRAQTRNQSPTAAIDFVRCHWRRAHDETQRDAIMKQWSLDEPNVGAPPCVAIAWRVGQNCRWKVAAMKIVCALS